MTSHTIHSRSVSRYRRTTTFRQAMVYGLLVAACCLPVRAEDALVAVATNFVTTAEQLAGDFNARSGHTVRLVAGSTGKLYAQVGNGAPFDVFLSADVATPDRLEREGRAVKGTLRIYATGRLVLWSAQTGLFDSDGAEWLRSADYRRISMANPRLAPYGLAARETLEGLGLQDVVADRVVLGENVGQAHTMVATGNADAGFVALSGVLSMGSLPVGSRWDVPPELHSPIDQAAVLLSHGEDNAAAIGFLDFLSSPEAIDTIRSAGYAPVEGS